MAKIPEEVKKEIEKEIKEMSNAFENQHFTLSNYSLSKEVLKIVKNQIKQKIDVDLKNKFNLTNVPYDISIANDKRKMKITAIFEE